MNKYQNLVEIIISFLLKNEDFFDLPKDYLEQLDKYIQTLDNKRLNISFRFSEDDCFLEEKINPILSNSATRSYTLEYISRFGDKTSEYIIESYLSKNEEISYQRKIHWVIIATDYICSYIRTHISSYAIIIDEVEKEIKLVSEKASKEIQETEETFTQNIKESEEKYQKTLDEKISGEYIKLQEKVDDYNKKISDSERKSIETSVTVLGVFSAIALAFNGAITISASTINALPDISPYRMIVFILLLGFVLINIIFALFYFMNAIIVRNSFKTSDADDHKQKSNKKSQALNKTYIIVIDAIIAAMIIATIVCWRCGVVENRDAEYPQTTTSISEEVSVTADIYIENQTQE